GKTHERADAVAAFFLVRGIAKADRMGLMIENASEDVYYDQRIHEIGAINVSIYPTLSEQEEQYIINDSGIKDILIGNTFLYTKILKIAANCRKLLYLIPAFPAHTKVTLPKDLRTEIIPFETILKEKEFVTAAEQSQITAIRQALRP